MPVTKDEIQIFFALLIYIGTYGDCNIERFWRKNSASIHRPMRHMTHYLFCQIKRYFHISAPTNEPQPWYMKLFPLFEHLRKLFKLFGIPSQNVSIDEMMVMCTGRSLHTVKMPNKPIGEGYKLF